MKIFLSLALIAFVMLGCSKDDDGNNDGNNNNNPPASGLTAKIDGAAWTSSLNIVTIKDGMTSIVGSTAKGTTLTINIVSDSTGTYQLDDSSVHTAMLVDGSGTYTSAGDSLAGGEVVISDIDTTDSTITGTFYFDLYDFSGGKKSVTEGTFTNLKFTSGNNGGGGNNGDGTMQMDVDGTTWTPGTVTSASALGLITLAGVDDGTNHKILFLLPDTISTGTYEWADLGIMALTYVTEDDIPLYPDSGSLHITTHNTTTNLFEGTFDFEATDMGNSTSVSVTNGAFSVNYLEK